MTFIPSNLFTPAIPEEEFHPQFRSLLNSPLHSDARSLINFLYQKMGKPSKKFIRNFQAGGFHSHLFEIACYAYLEHAKLNPDRTHSSPDFMVSREGISLAIEVTTANPPKNQAEDISLLALKNLSESEITYKVNVEFPHRVVSLLNKKLKKNYDQLPHCKGKPLTLMVAPFFESGSVYYTDENLVDSLYGITNPGNGFFSQPKARSISAVLYCNSFTVPRFFRLAETVSEKVIRATREGYYYAVDSDGELSIQEYKYLIGSPSAPQETWSEGVTVFFNPNAINPLPPHILPCSSSFSIQDRYLVREVQGFHPLTSYMQIYSA